MIEVKQPDGLGGMKSSTKSGIEVIGLLPVASILHAVRLQS
jgi:hypothetical protein